MKELDPLIGTTVSGRYRVHTLIGQGGMGKVFQAQQIPLNRAVALKVLEAGRVDAGFHRRFFQEAAILAKLKSRHTVTIYDYGRDGDLYFIAMELATGGTLGQLMAKEGPFTVPRALQIAQQICRSLREAHGQGVIHRDLKPGNVVITQSEDGEEIVKVLDFGLAKRLDRHSVEELRDEDTDNDTVPGSPKYMAPEVIRQQAIDGRTDIYGLGVMLYQMLCGVVPFDRENPMDILVAHLHEAPKPLREVKPELKLPEAVEALVMRCIEKAPEARYPDVQTLLDALRTVSTEAAAELSPAAFRPRPLGRAQVGCTVASTQSRGRAAGRTGQPRRAIARDDHRDRSRDRRADCTGRRARYATRASAESCRLRAAAPAHASAAHRGRAARGARGRDPTRHGLLSGSGGRGRRSPHAQAARHFRPSRRHDLPAHGAHGHDADHDRLAQPLREARQGRSGGAAPGRLRPLHDAPHDRERPARPKRRARTALPTEPACREEPAAEPPVELEAPPEPPVMDVRPAVPQADVIDLPEDQLGQP